MHTVELLDEAIDLAKQSGFAVREEWLGGESAGTCEFNGRRWLFIDLALSPREKLAVVVTALRSVNVPPERVKSPELQRALSPPKAA